MTIDYYYFTPLYFKEIATLTAISVSGRMAYCLVSIGRREDMILQAGRLDQAPIIHQVRSSLPLMGGEPRSKAFPLCLPWLWLVTEQPVTQTFPPRGRVNE